MSKEAMLTMKLEPELADVFMAEADACSDRPASQVVRELMCEFIERRRQAREYDTFQRARSTRRVRRSHPVNTPVMLRSKRTSRADGTVTGNSGCLRAQCRTHFLLPLSPASTLVRVWEV